MCSLTSCCNKCKRWNFISIFCCGKDRFKLTDQPCNKNKDYCYNGECVNYTQMCQIAYGSSILFLFIIIANAYFSMQCAFYIKKIITNHCKLYRVAKLRSYMKSICTANDSLCNYFICGASRNYKNEFVHSFVRKREKCIFPRSDKRKGILATAPFLMPCFKKSVSGKM
ncbi:hypothetical protein HZS_4108, partial [Henneguya salminicola]